MKKVFALLAIVGFVACNNAETKVEEKKADAVVAETPKKDSVIKENREKLKDVNLNSLKIRSNKKIICGGEVYESLFDRNDRKNEDDFFIDLDWLMVYDALDE